MNERAYFYALAITSVLCLVSAGIEYLSGNGSFFLVMLGPPMVFWGLIFMLIEDVIDDVPYFLNVVLFIPLVIIYYGLFYMPILIVCHSAAAAMVWGGFFLGFHLILYDIVGLLAAM